MAKNLSEVITRAEAVVHFNENLFPIQKAWELNENNGIPQWRARRKLWSTYVRQLHRAEQISDWQFDAWSDPHTHLTYAKYKWDRPISFPREEHFPDAKDWVYYARLEMRERGIDSRRSYRALQDARRAEGKPINGNNG